MTMVTVVSLATVQLGLLFAKKLKNFIDYLCNYNGRRTGPLAVISSQRATDNW